MAIKKTDRDIHIIDATQSSATDESIMADSSALPSSLVFGKDFVAVNGQRIALSTEDRVKEVESGAIKKYPTIYISPVGEEDATKYVVQTAWTAEMLQEAIRQIEQGNTLPIHIGIDGSTEMCYVPTEIYVDPAEQWIYGILGYCGIDDEYDENTDQNVSYGYVQQLAFKMFFYEDSVVVSEAWHKGKILLATKDDLSKTQNAVEVTYSALKDMRDNGELVTGQFYRITDYVTTTVQAETQSAGHAFDVVVVALDSHTLSETANAVQHNGDSYFNGCKLSAWELKYCLDNDTTRFAWADTENGKGVIYYMRDEYNNECPYDFKNIQFKLYAGTGSSWTSYLSSTGASATTIVPYRLTRAFNGVKIGKYTWNINTNDYTNAYTYSGYNDDKTTTDKTLHGDVHDCRIGNNWATVQKDDTETYEVLSLNFIVAIPFLLSQKDNTFNVYGNDFGINCHDIVISNNCYSNKLGDSCYNIHTPHNCYSLSCGTNCYSWACGDNCYNWTCGNNCYNWTCGKECYSWTCGNDCHSWTCADYCSNWTCGNKCYSWICGIRSGSWSCGNECFSWRCGIECFRWSCGNYCMAWSCGNSCTSWSCGNRSTSWSCGNGCSDWTCGNGCSSWKIGTSNILGNYVSNFHLGNGIKYLYISSTSTPTSTTPLKNFIIKNGVGSVDTNNRLNIIIDNEKFPLNADYELTIARNSKGEIVQYCEADLIQ